MVIPNDKVPTAKIRKSKAFCSSATEGSKEQLYEPNGKEEKKALQDLVQNLKRMLDDQNEYIITLRGEHNYQTLKRKRAPGSNDA